MQSSRNRTIIIVGVTALATFILSAFIFSVTDLDLFGASGESVTSGNFKHISGEPANRMIVQVYANDGSVFMDVTDRSGTFEIENLANGTYLIIASSLAQEYGYIGEWVLHEGSDSTFELAATGSLTGSIAGCDANCAVTVSYNNTAIVVQNVQADGSFVVSGLAPATYQVTVYKQNDSTTATVQINSGEQNHLDLAF